MPTFEPTELFGLATHAEDAVFVPVHADGDTSVEAEAEEQGPSVAEIVRAAVEEARADAYQEGCAAGREAAVQEITPVAVLLEGVARQLGEERSQYLKQHRRAIVELALAIAERIVERQIEADPELVVARIGSALALLPEGEPVLIEMNPEERDVLAGLRSEGFRALQALEAVRFDAQPDVALGSFRVSSGAASVDGRVPAALERIREEFSGLEGARPAEDGE